MVKFGIIQNWKWALNLGQFLKLSLIFQAVDLKELLLKIIQNNFI